MKRKIEVKHWMRQIAASSRRNRAYKRRWLNNANKIEAFEKHLGEILYSDSFTDRLMEEYIYFLKTRPKGYKAGTIRGFGQALGLAIRRADRAGYKANFGFAEIELPSEEPATVALTPAEVESIFRLKKMSKEAHAARERFIIACCTGMRFGDIASLSVDNLRGGVIKMKTRKTGVNVEIPMHWMVKEILNRNGGRIPKMASQQAFNTMVKRLARRAGINTPVLYEQTHGTKVVRKNIPKWRLISAHTARRSLATNMYLAGIPAARIMLITGHQTEQAFFRYIRIARSENAALLSNHSFFLGKA